MKEQLWLAEGPFFTVMKFGRVNYPCTTLLFNVHIGRFQGFVVLHHLRLQEERDEGGAGQVQEVVQHGTPVVQSNVK